MATVIVDGGALDRCLRMLPWFFTASPHGYLATARTTTLRPLPPRYSPSCGRL